MMKCEIIRDLIPLYLDKVCSEDSKKTGGRAFSRM